MTAAAAARKPRVIIIGGDKRIQRFRWPDSIEPLLYTSNDVGKAETAIRGGRVAAVYVLVKWFGHSEWKNLQTTAKRCSVELVPWPRGMGALAETLGGRFGADAAEAAPAASDDSAEQQKLEQRAVAHRASVSPEVAAAIKRYQDLEQDLAQSPTEAGVAAALKPVEEEPVEPISIYPDPRRHEVPTTPDTIVTDMQASSTSDRMIALMRRDAGRAWTHKELRDALDVPDGTASSALQILLRSDRVVVVNDLRPRQYALPGADLSTVEKKNLATRDLIIEAMLIDIDRAWTPRELHELTGREMGNVRATLHKMAQDGEVRCLDPGGTGKQSSWEMAGSPRKPPAPIEPKAPAAAKAAPAATAKAEEPVDEVYAISAGGRFTGEEYYSRAAAIAAMRMLVEQGKRDLRLWKEMRVKTRVVIEIE